MTTLTALATRINYIPRELKFFASASLVMGAAYAIVDTTFNNFLNDRFTLSGFERSFLEAPRELPGLLVVFVTALLWFLCSRRLGGVAMLLGVGGALLIGFASTSYTTMVLWLFIYSMGQHLFMPVATTIGMELAREGKTGQRLGQLNAIRNLAAVFGSLVVFVGFRFLGFSFHHTFILAAAMFAVAAVLMFSMKRQRAQHSKMYLKLHREYRLYYFLAVLFGSRKQIFVTFAPWVLVNILQQPTSILATLFLIGGIIGIMFQPLLGWTIDHLGERFVLASEAVLLIFVCAGYGFAIFLFSENMAFLIICGCFLIDQMLLSVSMARSTYIKKIARQPDDIQPALTTSVTIDHIFSISIALVGGLIWNAFGFQYVFALGAAIAAVNFFAAMQVRIPRAS
jgi:predicted MFS family arabinose efflux permease